MCHGRDKCRRCSEAGHIARQCPNPWGTGGGEVPVPRAGDVPAQMVAVEEIVEEVEVGVSPEVGDGGHPAPPQAGAVQSQEPGAAPGSPLWGEIMDTLSLSPVSTVLDVSSDAGSLPESAPLAAALLRFNSVSPKDPSSFELSPADNPAGQSHDGSSTGVLAEDSLPHSALLRVGEGVVGDPPSAEVEVLACSLSDSALVSAVGGGDGDLSESGGVGSVVDPLPTEVVPGGAPVGVGGGSVVPRPKRLQFKKGTGKAPPLPKRVVSNVILSTPALKKGRRGLSSLYGKKNKKNIVSDNDNENGSGNYSKDLNNGNDCKDLNDNNLSSSVVEEESPQNVESVKSSSKSCKTKVVVGAEAQSGGGGTSHSVCRMLSVSAGLCARPQSSSSPSVSGGSGAGAVPPVMGVTLSGGVSPLQRRGRSRSEGSRASKPSGVEHRSRSPGRSRSPLALRRGVVSPPLSGRRPSRFRVLHSLFSLHSGHFKLQWAPGRCEAPGPIAVAQSPVGRRCLPAGGPPSEDEGRTWFSSHGFLSVCAPGSIFFCGTVVLYHSSVTLAASVTDAAGRLVVCTFVQQQTTFRVFSVNAPNSVRERGGFFRSVCDRADPAVPSFLCGDFNAVFDEAVDRRDAATPLVASSRDLRDLFYQYGVKDIWRVMHPSIPGLTWHRPDGSHAARLDYIGVPDSWVPFVSSVVTIPCPFSDHCGLMLRVTAPCPLPRGPGRWKMNVSLLTDGDFLAAVECLWAEWRRKKASYRSVLR